MSSVYDALKHGMEDDRRDVGVFHEYEHNSKQIEIEYRYSPVLELFSLDLVLVGMTGLNMALYNTCLSFYGRSAKFSFKYTCRRSSYHKMLGFYM